MSLRQIASEISQHDAIDSIFPESTEVFRLFEDARPMTDPMLECVEYIIFPEKKLMWPVVRQFDVDDTTIIHRRLSVVRSIKDTMYSVDNIYMLSNDERGSWVFVRIACDDVVAKSVTGFLTTLDDVMVKEYGNVSPINILTWARLQKDFRRSDNR